MRDYPISHLDTK